MILPFYFLKEKKFSLSNIIILCIQFTNSISVKYNIFIDKTCKPITMYLLIKLLTYTLKNEHSKDFLQKHTHKETYTDTPTHQHATHTLALAITDNPRQVQTHIVIDDQA